MKKVAILLIAVICLFSFTTESEARWYSPQMGRFLSEDPIGFAGGDVNLYRYVGNNPANFTDPWGLKTWTCQRPLNNIGTGSKTGPDWSSNPFYHQFLCINAPRTGKIICSTQTPPKDGGFSLFGIPIYYFYGDSGNDTYSSKMCTEAYDDNKCLERCLSREFTKQRPSYSLVGSGTNCQEWSTSTLAECVSRCK